MNPRRICKVKENGITGSRTTLMCVSKINEGAEGQLAWLTHVICLQPTFLSCRDVYGKDETNRSALPSSDEDHHPDICDGGLGAKNVKQDGNMKYEVSCAVHHAGSGLEMVSCSSIPAGMSSTTSILLVQLFTRAPFAPWKIVLVMSWSQILSTALSKPSYFADISRLRVCANTSWRIGSIETCSITCE